MTNHSRGNSIRRSQPWAAVPVLRVALALSVGAMDTPAATLYWTGGSDVWQSTTAWSGAPAFPGAGDNAFFTNAATYAVTLNADVLNIQSNFFANAAGTTAIITLNVNSYELNPVYSGTSPGAFDVADVAGSTTVVYLASSTLAGKGLVVPGRIIVGRDGFGTLIVTNGNVSVATTILANAGGGSGLLVLSGQTTVWSNSSTVAIGNNSNSFGSTLVISNGALMDVVSTFRLGSGSSSSGSSGNTLILDSGGRLYTHTGPVTVGNNSTVTTSPSYNNSTIVQGGAVWDNGNSTFFVGTTPGSGIATGNVLTVGTGGVVTNISHLTITADNTLNVAGGVVNALTDCAGTLQGFGTVRNNVTVTGAFNPFNSLGTLAFSNQLSLASTATTTVQLGTNSNPTIVRGILTLGGTLNIVDGGGFTAGTYTLFTYKSTLASSGLTIGTIPSGGYTCTIDTDTVGVVKLDVTGGPPSSPVAVFTGNPTNGVVGTVVTFTDNSTGTITNRFWDFGDGATTNTLGTSLTHTYDNLGSYDVSLTVSGPGGTDTLTQSSYVTIGNTPPTITAGATVTNAALQVDNVIVVVAGDTNTFSVGATDPGNNPLSYQWSFGDGVTNAWSPSNTVDHIYTTNCGPYNASVAISNGLATITSNFTIVVACQLNLSKLTPKLNFARTNSDSCTVTGTIDLPADTSFAGTTAILDIGGGSLTFTLPAKGTAINGASRFSTPKFNKQSGLWTLKVSFKDGFWQTEWANYGMINSTIATPGALVTNLPVVLLLDTEAFMTTTDLHYTAKEGKSGSAK